MIKICTTLPDGPEVCTTVDLAHDAVSRAYSATIGNGTDLSFTLTHNLDSLDFLTSVRDVATGAVNPVAPSVFALTPDTARLDFTTAPTTGQFKVTLVGITPSV